METRKPYPTDVSDEEWAFVAPYLTLLPVDAEQRKHDLREVCNATRWIDTTLRTPTRDDPSCRASLQPS